MRVRTFVSVTMAAMLLAILLPLLPFRVEAQPSHGGTITRVRPVVDGNVAIYDGTTGFFISDSGVAAGSLNTNTPLWAISVAGTIYNLSTNGVLITNDLAVNGTFQIGSGASPTNIATSSSSSNAAELMTSGAIQDAIAAGGGGGGFVQSTSTSSWDWSEGYFVPLADATWKTLDYSTNSVGETSLPAGTTYAVFRILLTDDGVASTFHWQGTNRSSVIADLGVFTQVAGAAFETQGTVTTDGSQSLNWKLSTSATNATICRVKLVGWGY